MDYLFTTVIDYSRSQVLSSLLPVIQRQDSAVVSHLVFTPILGNLTVHVWQKGNWERERKKKDWTDLRQWERSVTAAKIQLLCIVAPESRALWAACRTIGKHDKHLGDLQEAQITNQPPSQRRRAAVVILMGCRQCSHARSKAPKALKNLAGCNQVQEHGVAIALHAVTFAFRR